MDKATLIYLIKLGILFWALLLSYLIIKNLVSLLIFKTEKDRRNINLMLSISGLIVLGGLVLWAIMLNLNKLLILLAFIVSYGLSVLIIRILLKAIIKLAFKYNYEVTRTNNVINYKSNNCKTEFINSNQILLTCKNKEFKIKYNQLIKYL